RGEQVALSVTLRFGNEKTLTGQVTAAEFLGPLMTRGTDKYTRQQIQDELDRLGARLAANSGTSFVNFTVEVKKENLPKVVELLQDIMQHPTFPLIEFDIMKREARDGLQKFLTDPQMLAFRAIQRQLNPVPKGDVRYTPTVEEELALVE